MVHLIHHIIFLANTRIFKSFNSNIDTLKDLTTKMNPIKVGRLISDDKKLGQGFLMIKKGINLQLDDDNKNNGKLNQKNPMKDKQD